MAASAKPKSRFKAISEIIIMFFLAAFSLLLGINSSQEYYRMKSVGVETTAYIVDTYQVPRIGTGYTVEFYTLTNTKVVVNLTNLEEVKKGDTVKILYDPNVVETVILANSKPKGWVGYIMSGILLLIAILASLALVLDSRSANQNPPNN